VFSCSADKQVANVLDGAPFHICKCISVRICQGLTIYGPFTKAALFSYKINEEINKSSFVIAG
jgi:hypothetical protein